VLVAKLAFEPEHAEVVAADKVDVITGLVLDPRNVVERHVGYRRIGEVDIGVDMLLLGEEHAAFDADVAGAVGRRGWSRNDCRSNCGEEIIAHWGCHPFL